MDLKYLIAKAMKILLNPPAKIKCKIDRTSKVCSGSELTRVEMGRYSYIGNRCFLVNVKIGNFCSIADRCLIGGATHPIERVSTSPVFHSGKNIMKKNFSDHPAIATPETVIGNDVWLGMGCLIKAGVTIGNGAVVGMGSVVTKDIPPYEIWAGNPARKIRDRLDKDTSEKINKSEWWNFETEDLMRFAPFFSDTQEFINKCNKD